MLAHLRGRKVIKKDPRRFYLLALKYAPFDEEFEPEVVQKKLKQLK